MTKPSYNEADAAHAEVALTKRLIAAFSPSGHEHPAAEVLLAAFRDAGFDEAYLDPAGNAVGVMYGGLGKTGRTVMLNGHIDTVPLGDAHEWAYPPLSGEVADGRIYGRGACDMKAALACMVYAATDARAELDGTVVVTGVVQEEVGGLGARYLGETMTADVVILGEPSKLRLMLGHRGRVEVAASLPGKIAHAAKNELGDNALYRAGRFLEGLEGLTLPTGGPLGGSSLTPTSLTSYPENGKNVVPGRAELTIDYRNIPGDEPEAILARLGALAPDATLSVPDEHAVSESGEVSYTFPRIVPFYQAQGDHPDVVTARETLGRVMEDAGQPFAEGYWWFGTDAPHLVKTTAKTTAQTTVKTAAEGVVIGFGPGEEELAHTTRESVPVAHLKLARAGYAALLRAYLGAETSGG